ncbi:MAG: hypothetical protein ABSC25_15935 [Roseiarcus sp.]|jgi:hypothetical protein
MFSNLQLSNFKRYVETTPSHLLGKAPPFNPIGAYDSKYGARDHGFGRTVRASDFARGGAFDVSGANSLGVVDPETEDTLRSKVMSFLKDKLSSPDFDRCNSLLLGEATDGLHEDINAERETRDEEAPDHFGAMQRFLQRAKSKMSSEGFAALVDALADGDARDGLPTYGRNGLPNSAMDEARGRLDRIKGENGPVLGFDARTSKATEITPDLARIKTIW